MTSPTALERPRSMGRKHSGTNPNPDGPEPFHVKLSRLVDARRGERTDTEIAKAAGMSRSHLSRILTGDIPNPRIDSVLNIIKAVGGTFTLESPDVQ